MNNQLKRASLALGTLVIIGFVFFIGYESGKSSVVTMPTGSVLNLAEGKPDSVDFSPFWRAWGILDEKFAGTTTPDQEKIWGAIKGLTKSFNDPYTVFMPPEESRMFEESVSGKFQGIGMEVGIKDGIITVVAPLKNTPAEKAGIKPGDKVVKIDGVSTDGYSIDRAIKLIRGDAGTTVVLTLLRGDKAPFDVSITRAYIDLPVVGTQIKNNSNDTASSTTADSGTGLRKDGTFVIELYSFSANSAQLFREALEKFIKTGSRKLIIDLRGNPGGYLDAAVDIASWSLPPGAVVVKEDHKDLSEQIHRSKGYDVFSNGTPLKLVILIDGGSASASEILAGALSDHGIAKLVGTKSFGKGSVQELVKLTQDTSLKVTIAKWLTPNGVSISEKGIKPDYEVKFTEEDLKNKKDPQMDKAIEILNQ